MVFAVVALATLGFAFSADAAVANFLNLHTSPGVHRAMSWISKIGDWPAHVAAGILLATIAWWRGSKRWLRIFLSILVACALAGAMARVVKIGAGRSRPSVQSQAGWNGPRLSSKYQSFPSGHTAASTAFFVVLLLARGRLVAPLLIVPFVVALSRMIVGAHYFSDITFAAIIGVICAVVVSDWNRAREDPTSSDG